MAVNKNGSYTKLTEETVKALEQAFSIDATVEEACFFADISKQTYYNWIKDNEKMKERFDALRQKPILKARQELVKGLTNFDNAMKYLERKKKAEFSTRTELTGKEGEKLIEKQIDDSEFSKLMNVYEENKSNQTPEGTTDDESVE